MLIKIIAGLLIGGGIGSLMGYYGQCSSGTCPLTASPLRGALFGAIFGLLFSMSLPGNTAVSDDDGENAAVGDNIIHISGTEQFDKAIKDNKVVLVDFYADWCGPCRQLAPIIAKLAKDYNGKAAVCKIDVEDKANGDLAEKFGVSGIPMVLLFVNGKKVEEAVGRNEEAFYRAWLDKYTAEKKDE